MYLLYLPLLIFWILLIVGRHELGWRWIVGLISAWCILLVATAQLGRGGFPFVACQAVLVIIMAYKIFGIHQPRSY
jgi:hypothetical protein